MNSHVSLFLSNVYMFFSFGYKIPLVGYLKKNYYDRHFSTNSVTYLNIGKDRHLAIPYTNMLFDFAPNFSYHYCLPNRSGPAFTECEVKIRASLDIMIQ